MSQGGGRGRMLETLTFDSFDPMNEAFNDNSFNSYTRGPGAFIKSSHQVEKRRSKEGSRYFKLHITNVPIALNDDAIRFLFETYGRVKSVYLHIRGGGSTNWSFVEYEHIDEAQRAIEGLNRAPPHNMNVRFSRDTAEKVDKIVPGCNEVFKQELPANETISTPRPGAGRGRCLPLIGRSPQSFNVKRQQSDNYYDESQKNNHDVAEFNLYDAPESVNISNEVIARSVNQVQSNGGLGRGLSKLSVLKERKPRIPEFTSEQEELIENWVEDVSFYEENEEDVYSYGSELPYSPGRCQYCHKPAMKLCSVCKAWYCSFVCIKADWSKHKIVCNLRTAEFSQDGHLKYTRVYTDNQMQLKVLNHSRPKDLNDSSSTDSGPTRKQNHRRNSNASRKNKSTISNKGSCSDLSDSSKSDLNKTQEKRHVNRNALKKPDVFIKKPDIEQKQDYKRIFPIPTDTFTKVVCTWIEKPYYWVFKEESLSLNRDIVNTLMEHCGDPVIAADPTLENKCCALFEGFWYRAKILSKTDTTAKVFFVDYGNEAEINLNEMKPLPQKLISIKPQSHKIKFVEGTQVDLDIENKNIANVKAIKMDDDVCIVQLEGGPGMIKEPKPLKMPLPSDRFVTVQINEPEKEDEYWVIIEQEIPVLCTLSDTFKSSGTLAVAITDPILNEMYLVSFKGIWCRAKVTKLNPLTVLYIDYGNSELCKIEDLRPVPIKYRDILPMAIKIKLAKGTPQQYFKLASSKKLSVKAVGSLDGSILVHVEGVTYNEELEVVQPRMPNLVQPAKKKGNHVLYLTEANATGVMIQVQKVMGENCLTGTLVLTDEKTNSPVYMTNEEITNKLANTTPDPTFKPSLGDPVCARIDKSWFRGYVMVQRNDKIKVALVDFGLVMAPDAIAPMSQETAIIAEAGIRCIFTTPVDKLSKLIGDQFSLTNIKKEAGKLIAEIASFGKVTIAPWEPIYEDGGLSARKLKSEMQVQISSFHAPNAVYLRSMEQEEILKFNELIQDIGRYSLTAPPLTRKPLCGELVICKYAEDQVYYRAQVFKKIEENYQVIFVDYGNIETVSVSDMKALDNSFKAIPCFAIKVGLKGIPGSSFNRAAVQILNFKLDQTYILTVMFEKNNLREVRLFDGDRELNVLIQLAMEPSWKSNEEKHDDVTFMAADVLHERWLAGQKIRFITVYFISFNEVMVCDEDSPTLAHITKVLTKEITEYCNKENSPYNPRTNEVCLALYKEGNESLWYRAICMNSFGTMASVFFIDYGNHGEILIKDIRKMTKDFMEPPAALKKCKIYGLSDTLPENVKQEIQALSGDSFEGVCIEVTDDECSLIYMPKVNEILAENGLPPINPPPIPSPSS